MPSPTRHDRRRFLQGLGALAATGAASALFPQLELVGRALAAAPVPGDYRALVCIFLFGGNDSYNMLIPHVQTESARALGLSVPQMIRYVTLPQGLTRSVPAIAANAIFIVKETSVFTVIAVPELTNTARDLIGMYYHTNEYLLELVVAYAIILIPLSLVLTLLERRVRRASFRSA